MAAPASAEPRRGGGIHTLVTGGSSGIGLACAERLVRAGEVVTLVARDGERLAAACDRLTEIAAGRTAARRRGASSLPGAAPGPAGPGCETATSSAAATAPPPPLAIVADVTDEEAIVAAVAEATRTNGPVLRLIASAGVSRPGRFEDIPAAEFRRQMEINYIGTVNAVRAVLPHMRAAGRGRIGLLSSGAGLIGVFGYTAYSASKFAVRGFGEALAAELAGTGIRLSICYPPDTDTPMHRAELGLKPPETEAMTGSGGMMSADQVARELLRGMDRGELHVTPGLEMGLLHRFGGLADPLLRWYLNALAERARRRIP